MTSATAHIGLSTQDLSASIDFYSTLFDAAPSRERDDYAQFLLDSPSLNLSLTATANLASSALPNHFGIEVDSKEQIDTAVSRLRAKGMPLEVEGETVCCYSLHTKVWTRDPDGRKWEIFVVHDRNQTVAKVEKKDEGVDSKPCCAPTCCT